MTIVVDASVGLKLVLPERGSDAARALIASEQLMVPDLFYAECANVLWVKARKKDISPGLAAAGLAAISAISMRRISVFGHSAAALALALELDRTAYDCLYLAVALAERATLVTADASFFKVVSAHSAYGSAIRLLM